MKQGEDDVGTGHASKWRAEMPGKIRLGVEDIGDPESLLLSVRYDSAAEMSPATPLAAVGSLWTSLDVIALGADYINRQSQ